jgi:hypothetical protein
VPARAYGFKSLPRYHLSRDPLTAATHLPRWRNWYTRTFEGRMRQLIRVQVPAWAPKPQSDGVARLPTIVTLSYSARGRLAQLVRAPRLHRGGRWFESSTAHQMAALRPVRPWVWPSIEPRPRTWSNARHVILSRGSPACGGSRRPAGPPVRSNSTLTTSLGDDRDPSNDRSDFRLGSWGVHLTK